jgi:hypothetical protein|tara:strand:- start:201 stop:425 length:225 start_codon:yes stop_codon:yes gene_type:complete
MDFEKEFELEHLLLTTRKCRTCGKTKDLLDGFYMTRKDRGSVPSAYSYECKSCTINRVLQSRIIDPPRWEYPDW